MLVIVLPGSSIAMGHSHQLTAMEFVARLLVGAVLGVFIGLERQRRQSAAGVHTSSLVCVGATLFAMIEPLLGDSGNQSRVIANIVTGVGFLAGGVILKEGTNVRGLNTAATIWATAAVGSLAGVGLYMEATLAAAVIIGLNVFMGPVVTAINRRSRRSRDEPTAYALTIKCAPEAEGLVRQKIVEAVSDSILTLRSMSGGPAGGGLVSMTAELLAPASADPVIEQLSNALAAVPGVSATAWSSQDSG